MKRLFSRKNYRRVFYRYLVMYFAVLFLFTTVVTYSKYISMISSNSNARVAKFDADISYLGNSLCVPGGEVCEMGSFRPTSPISYYFQTDVDFEVSTLFVLSIFIDSDFDIVGLYQREEGDNDYTAISFSKNTNLIELKKVIAPNEGKKVTYKIVVRYTGENLVYHDGDSPYYEYQEKSIINQEIVKVSYSAKQLKGGK